MKTSWIFLIFLGPLLINIIAGKSPDIVIRYENNNVGFRELTTKLNITIGERFLSGCDLSHSASCERRCYKTDRRQKLKCYCDELCQELGDCCFDYSISCTPKAKLPHTSVSCLLPKGSQSTSGYVVINSCPRNADTSSTTVRACVTDPKADRFKSLPVFDHVTNLTYKNYFCAKCNHASNLTFWRVKAKCDRSVANNLSSSDVISSCGEFRFMPYDAHQSRFCVLRRQHSYTCLLKSDHKIRKTVEDLCKAYLLPVCYESKKYDNPHCLLCSRIPNNMNAYCPNYCGERFKPGPPLPLPGCIPEFCPPPPLTVLFDFSSRSQYKLNIEGRQHVVTQTAQCTSQQVYDPFSKRCRDSGFVLVSDPSPVNITEHNNSSSPLPINCTSAIFNLTEVELLRNGSLYVKPHGAVYSKSLYVMHGEGVEVCTSFSSNYTTERRINSNFTQESAQSFALRIITYVGGSLSIVCLILLLVVYVKVSEYKKMSGKIAMSLSLALLVYQVLFFLTGLTGNPDLCSAVAVAVHYFLLASFAWTSVLALEIATTFVSKNAGIKSHSGYGQKKKFIKYCFHGWITPLVWVGVCVAIEWTDTFTIGYGSNSVCWISNSRALLYVLCVPVAAILAFNIVALVLSVCAIRRARRSTRLVSKDRKQLHLPLLSFKMTGIFGLTWALGFAVPFKKTSFLLFPFVILNSSQGLLVFLALKVYSKLYTAMKKRTGGKPSTDTSHKSKETQIVSKKTTSTNLMIALDPIQIKERADRIRGKQQK